MSTTRVFVSGEIRELPSAIWDRLQGPKPDAPEDFIGNGCTMSPDFIVGKATWPACVVHDYQYNVGATPRKDADANLRTNLRFCLEAEGMLTWLARGFSFFYWLVVRREGRKFYNGKGDPS